MIELINVDKYFGSHHVLRQINKTFSTARIHGIVGLNGAGKTTLFNVMANVESCTGKITMNKEPIDSFSRKRIAMMPTQPYFFPQSTGEEYVAFMAHAKGVSLKKIEDVNLFQLPLKEIASTYSSGMKKKLAFCGILIGDHNCYIFDEPFNGVDLEGNMIIKKELKKLKAAGKTIFISSHILSSLTEVCDEIHWLDKGEFIMNFNEPDFDKIESEILKKIY